ncbi:hypothetical protein ACQR10_04365 [Bradyrhizobium sp. HKCCYLRH2060]|uniref:hypothetical protein n=1 Tax=Bradyrhizobium sp. HKCCYLRH2060 TaxID=3420743 RepID=UPI003EBAB016
MSTIDLHALDRAKRAAALLELARACAIADGPSEALDDAISTASDWDPIVIRAPFTYSLDLARRLIPAGHWWAVAQTAAPDSPLRHFGATGNGIFLAQVGDWRAPQPHTARNDDPVLALCAAALRARAALVVMVTAPDAAGRSAP